MSTDEADIYKLDGEFNHYYQPVIVAFDIEDIVLITYVVNAIECFLYIGKASPLAPFYNGSPFLQSNL